MPSITEYLQNPVGKGSSAMNARIIREGLERRYPSIEKKGITHTVYETGRGQYLFHVLIPSETERENTYDVCIEVTGSGGITVKEWDLKVFSNSPSFVFTFAYAYQKKGMIIPSLTGKYPSIVLKQRPRETNPYELLNYEKTLFFAIHYLLENHYLNLGYITTHVKKFHFQTWIHSIRTSDVILREIQKEDSRLKKEKKEEEEEKKRAEKSFAKRALQAAKSSVGIIAGKKPVRKISGKKKLGSR